jgi:hypothetical protein
MQSARPPADLTELRATLAREMAQAVGGDDSTLSSDRQLAMIYYEGRSFPEDNQAQLDGRSRVVMRSVMEAIEWVLPALLRIFTASDKIADIGPINEQDEQAADQATKYISHIFYRDNNGFKLLHDWLKDGLLQKLGWVKYWWDASAEQVTNTYTGLTREQYDALLGDDTDVEVIEKREYPADADEFNLDRAVPAQVMLYDCTLRTTRENGRVKIEAVPPDEVLFSPRSKFGDIPFLCHRTPRTISELLTQGYDADTLHDIPFANDGDLSGERARRFDEEGGAVSDDRSDFPMRRMWVEESYIRWDRDGDGIAELLKVVSVSNGGHILTRGGKEDIEDIDEIPLVPFTPIPTPHKLVGNSVADLVMDLQFVKSTLIRQMLDNLYLTNNPRHIVGERALTDDTYDDLLMSRPGGIVRALDPAQIVPLVTPFVAEKAFPMVEYIDQMQEIRTGVSRRGQGIDSDVLNKTANSGLQEHLQQQAAAQRVELIARIAGDSVQMLVRGILGLVQRHQQQERIIRLTGQWLKMDPRQWRNSMEVTVSVGLGTGNRDQMLQHLMTILQLQQGIVQIQQGVQGPLVYPHNVFDALERLTENAGFQESFFTDPSQPPPQGAGGPQQPKPDPEMMKAQAHVQAAQFKAQADAQGRAMQAQVKAALDQQAHEHKLVLEREKAAHDMQLAAMREQMKAQNEAREIALRAASGAYTDERPGQGAANG